MALQYVASVQKTLLHAAFQCMMSIYWVCFVVLVLVSEQDLFRLFFAFGAYFWQDLLIYLFI